VRQIFPVPGRDLDDADLAELYALPPGAPWLRANMVASADGGATDGGLSAGLSGPGDRRIFHLLRAIADLILVGAGTARDEGYRPAVTREQWRYLRAGRAAAAPIALISGRLDLDPSWPLFTDAPAGARTIIVTSASAPRDARSALAKVADIITAGEDAIDLRTALDLLRSRGVARVSCEGGPSLLASLAGAGLLDELCLTVSPLLAGPGARRIMTGPEWRDGTRGISLAHTLEEDGFLFTRYVRAAPAAPITPAAPIR
jgi:riboflavin biosynthesis pyrimidine reductase